ncbi:hypothetical protein HCH_03225 [Hahella chejuensis KCTC 2396]|uniref:Uncharacterized protein n=1 Tax=Hahella chejuensis (strain KCTC 2396) TaxID=349521 RepID=Q2SH87_HAHCH|nr:hypothetical protein [Hahella chejuensis]ABC29987.1 hypothetical protein HCH_03225 [Hahella chejuensis KCTC 2396]
MKHFAALTALMVAFTGFTSAAHAEGQADRYCDDDYAKKTYSSATYASAGAQGDATGHGVGNVWYAAQP